MYMDTVVGRVSAAVYPQLSCVARADSPGEQLPTMSEKVQAPQDLKRHKCRLVHKHQVMSHYTKRSKWLCTMGEAVNPKLQPHCS